MIATEGDYIVGRRLNVPIIVKRGIRALAGRMSYVKAPALNNTRYYVRYPLLQRDTLEKRKLLREERLVFATPSLQIKIASSLLSEKLGRGMW